MLKKATEKSIRDIQVRDNWGKVLAEAASGSLYSDNLMRVLPELRMYDVKVYQPISRENKYTVKFYYTGDYSSWPGPKWPMFPMGNYNIGYNGTMQFIMDRESHGFNFFG